MAFRISVIRPDDLLNLQIECRNLQLDADSPDGPVLVAEDAAQKAYLIVHFPPQTIAEEAVFESFPMSKAPPNGTPDEPVRQNDQTCLVTLKIPEKSSAHARLGEPTRLVFQLPANSNPRIPYTIEGLLDWAELELSVSPIADVPEIPTSDQWLNAPAITPPSAVETAIELPYRLILSPNHSVVWTHATTPKTHDGRTELWHTRLAQRTADGGVADFSKANPAPLRAIWSPDYVARPSEPEPSWPKLGASDQWAGADVLTAMNSRDRHELVILTSAFKGFIKSKINWATYRPKPIHAEQMILSALGGWLKSRGEWEPPHEWIHKRHFDVDPINPIERLPRNPVFAVPRELIRPLLFEDMIHLLDPVRGDGPPPWALYTGEPGPALNISEWVHVATQGRDHYVRIVYEGFLYPFGHRAALIKVTERKFREVNGTPFAYLAQRMFILVRKPLKDYMLADDTQESLPNKGLRMPLKQVRLTTLVTPDIDQPQPIGGEYSFWIKVGGNDFRFHAVGQDSVKHTVDFTAALIFVPNSDAVPGRIQDIRTHYNLAVNEERRGCLVPGQMITYAEPYHDPNIKSDNTTLLTRSLYFDTDDAPKAKFLPKLEKAAVNLTAVEQLLGTTAPTDIQYYSKYRATGFEGGNEVFAELLTKVQSKFSADKGGGFATPDLSITAVSRKSGPIAGHPDDAAANKFDPGSFFEDVKDSATLFGKIRLGELIAGGDFDCAPTIQFLPQNIPPQVMLHWTPDIEDEVSGGFFLSYQRSRRPIKTDD